MLLQAFSQASGDYRSIATGDWNVASNWQRYNGSSWVTAGGAPSSTNGVITIQGNDTITNTTSITVDQLIVNGTLVQNSTMNIANGTGDDILIYGIAEFRGTSTTIQNNATCEIYAIWIKLFSTVTNNGTVNWNVGDFSFDGGTFINNKNFNESSNSSLHGYNGGGTFINTVTGVFTHVSGIMINYISFTNNGIMNFQAGSFSSYGTGAIFTNTGTLNFSGGAHFSNSASAFFNAGSKITGTGNFVHNSDSIRINLALSFTSDISVTINGGAISGSGSIKFYGTVDWLKGFLLIPTTIQNTGTLSLNLGEVVLMSTLTNNGTINWNNGTFSFYNGKFVNNGTFNIAGNNIMYNYGGGSATNGLKGTFSKTSIGGTTMNMPFTNIGTITGVGYFQFGANLTNKGTFAPGNSIGILTTGTNYINKKLQIEMHDAGGVGVGNDELMVDGDTKIKDTLEILLTGIVPAGDYTILSCAGTLSGKFSTVKAPAGFTVKNSGKNVMLHVPQPGVSVNDKSIAEGNSGSKQMKFIVSLAFPSNLATSVDYQTHDSTAKAPKDYVASTATLNFAPGEVTDTISVSVKGDTTTEADELFYVKLLNPVNLALAKDTGIGTIVNNDGVTPVAMRGDQKESDASTIPNTLIIPNVLHRNQAWVVPGLSQFHNTVAVIDANGIVVYKSVNNQNTISIDKLTAGLYFYQITTSDQNGREKIYKGKLLISD
jgi:hypothetical protein